MICQFTDQYAFLSNFHPCRIFYENDWYPSVEHAFQAAKTTNPEERRRIREAKTPGKAKSLGRQVTLRPGWPIVKLKVMKSLVKQKFIKGELRDKLIATGEEELIEGNSWNDHYWGVCNGHGENHLGKILMDVRSEVAQPGPAILAALDQLAGGLDSDPIAPRPIRAPLPPK